MTHPTSTFACADCGRRTTKPVPAFLCDPCVKERKYLRMKRWRLRNPDYATRPRVREYKRQWAAKRAARRPPILCNTCGVELARITGRHHDAACAECARLNRNYGTALRKARAFKPKPLYSCRTCGVAVPRARGRTAEKARCQPCIRADARKWDRSRRAA